MNTTQTSHQPLPPLEPHDADLFDALAGCNFCLHTLAQRTGRRLADITHWRAQSHIHAYVTFFKACENEASGTKARQHTETGLNTLQSVIATTNNPIEQRRAATTMVRAAAPLLKLLTPPKEPAKPKPTPAKWTPGPDWPKRSDFFPDTKSTAAASA